MAEPRSIADGVIPPNPQPPIAGYERHFLGRFGEAVVTYLGCAKSPGKIEGREVFLVVDSIDLGDSPFGEELAVDFHLSPEPPPADYIPHWGPFAPGRHVERPLEYETSSLLSETRYSFVFTSAMSIGENEAEFLDFLRDEAGVRPPVRDDAARGTSETLPRPEGSASSLGLGDGAKPTVKDEPTSRRTAS